MLELTHPNDPVTRPSHYCGASGVQSIAVTHAYRLGPDLSLAVDYLLRAGREKPDPRQYLAIASFYLRYAARTAFDVAVFGIPKNVPWTPAEVAAEFELDAHRAMALGLILQPLPCRADLEAAACKLDMAAEAYAVSLLPVANSGRAA